MPVKGADQIKKRYAAVIADIAGPRTEQALNAILITAAAYAKLYTPVDVSTLVNSQRKEVRKDGQVMVGVLGYYGGVSEKGFAYGWYLETHDNWKPRKKKSAKPHFLQSGFEDPEPRSDIQNIIKGIYKL